MELVYAKLFPVNGRLGTLRSSEGGSEGSDIALFTHGILDGRTN